MNFQIKIILLIFCLLFFPFICASRREQNKIESINKAKQEYLIEQGSTTIPGTWDWDIDVNEIAGDGLNDLHYITYSDGGRTFRPLNRSKIAIIKKLTYENTELKDLVSLTYTENEVRVGNGTIFAMYTSDDNIAKLKVTGFRNLKDFNFKEAVVIPEEWKNTEFDCENMDEYHVEVKWTLYRKLK